MTLTLEPNRVFRGGVMLQMAYVRQYPCIFQAAQAFKGGSIKLIGETLAAQFTSVAQPRSKAQIARRPSIHCHFLEFLQLVLIVNHNVQFITECRISEVLPT